MTSLIVSEMSRDSAPSGKSFSAGDPEAANDTFLTPWGARGGCFFSDVLALPGSLDGALGSYSPLSKSFLVGFLLPASSSDSDSMKAP